VQNYPLIISKPPPYWWYSEKPGEAELFQSSKSVFNGRNDELLYSGKSGIVYLIRFDGEVK
jgi:hypothetical protein